MKQFQTDSDFLHYIVENGFVPGARLPALHEMSAELGVSIGKLREQLEGARVLGLVAARPRRGIECNSYSFTPAARASLMFGLATDERLFGHFSELRNAIESAFWQPAVQSLTEDDKQELDRYVSLAWHKLQRSRIQIPHQEHRAFHMTIFRRLDNLFATGLLEAYWDAYEAVELNLYADYNYLTEVWTYHQGIAAAIQRGEVDSARALHEEHLLLLRTRGVSRNGELDETTVDLRSEVRSPV
jgi:DNA-binding FadR family transcriptional regulator